MPAWTPTPPRGAASTPAISTSVISCAWSMASTTCSATARWCACRRTGTRQGTSRLRLRLESGEVVLAADACYFCQTLRERRLPRYMHDREAMLASLDRLEALEQGGARIFFGHDPEFWQTVPRAPTPHRMTPTVRSCSTSTTTEKRRRLATARFRERLYPVEQAR